MLTPLPRALPALTRAYQLLLSAALAYACVITALYFFGAYPRHRVESGWLIFAALCVMTATVHLASGRDRVEGLPADRRILAVMLAGAGVLYAQSFGVGRLSDDYVLLAASGAGRLAPAEWEHFRPLPLAIWAVLESAGIAAPWLLHAINIAAHGANAYLLSVLAREFGASRAAAFAAGAIFLTFPGSVEPVTWIAGFPDVLVGSLVLGFLIAMLRSHHTPGIALLVLATLTKESAVCAPVLLTLAWPMRRVKPAPLAIAFAWCVIFAIARLTLKPAPEPLDAALGYFLKQMLAAVYGGLAMPWTRDQMFGYPWLMLLLLLALAALLAGAVMRSTDRGLWTRAAIFTAWALVAAAPVYRYLFISPELQGSRYLYLPSIGWALLLASLAFEYRRTAALAILAIVVAASAAGAVMQQNRWRAAAEFRDGVIQHGIEQARALGCAHPVFVEGPDSHAGVYVFRNGLAEAMREAGAGDAGPVDCTLRWDGGGWSR